MTYAEARAARDAAYNDYDAESAALLARFDAARNAYHTGEALALERLSRALDAADAMLDD